MNNKDPALLAESILKKLYERGEKFDVGIRQTKPKFKESALKPYRSYESISKKEQFEAVMCYARDEGAIEITFDKFDTAPFINQIQLLDLEALARVLNITPNKITLTSAKTTLAPYVKDYPVLNDVIDAWALLKNVRRTKPSEVDKWVDACTVINYCRNQHQEDVIDLPVRDTSANLFKDSKRIEAITPLLDVLLTETINGEVSSENEVLKQIGLYREPQPIRLTGNVCVVREVGCFPLDIPYCALPASTILGCDTSPESIITIENLTTFNVWAKQKNRDPILCIYTSGMPSPAWRAMYTKILKSIAPSTPIYHWGDIDEGGFRISSVIAKTAKEVGFTIQPWKMNPEEMPKHLHRPASRETLERMSKYCLDTGWVELERSLRKYGVCVEQEGST